MIGPPLPLEKREERNVPQTICFRMRQEWFCSFQRQRQAPVHNDVSVMGWQIEWKTMTLAWETHQWAAAQLWSQRALRHTFWTPFVSQLYEPTNEDTACFQAGQYTISFQQTHDLMTEDDLFLHHPNPPSPVLLGKKSLNQGQIEKRVAVSASGDMTILNKYKWNKRLNRLHAETNHCFPQRGSDLQYIKSYIQG